MDAGMIETTRKNVVVTRATEHETAFPGGIVRVDECPVMIQAGYALQGG